ncbi:unnamed protein product [Heligmosomoides polygyrus]|uniref:HUN domain-containing protein n=1 Tax=Heligmosomoides polygyrus TaxID=6339 RepID=A0A3P7X8U8_HELPZ|nr:unnamed protein product [Heligmosomoides polygyrus]
MIDQFYEDEDKDGEKHEKHDFAPISGDEFLRRDDSVKIGDGVKYKPKHKPTEDNDDIVKPVYVNEAKIGQENEEDMKDSDELSKPVGGPISVVAIAVRENAKEMEPAEEDYEPSSSFPINCHFTGQTTRMNEVVADVMATMVLTSPTVVVAVMVLAGGDEDDEADDR